MSDKTCISCSMPMIDEGDYPNEDTSKDYCVHCARDDGSLKSFEEALAGMTSFLVANKGMDEDEAGDAAFDILVENPAWREYSKK